MRTLLWVTAIGLGASGCATNAPQMAWGKPGVTRIDYGTDVGTCTGRASMQGSGGNGANTAGGISGSNSSVGNVPSPSGSSVATSAAATGGASSGSRSAPTPAGGTYSGMATSDYAARAATQQRTQEMAAQRARAEAFKGCLTERGYQEFALTAEQRTHLATLKKGSAEYHEYLYQLGTNAEIVGAQSRSRGQ